jgi:SpoVK/Ycf46/Vps4 family AAA+-type ATPase
MDEAFLRRLRFVVEFPKPDAAAREKIWQQCFLGVTQLSDAVNLADLARRINVSGGSIRQIALRAAFAAAADREKILTRHVHEAARAELLKLGMSSAAGEFITQAA